MKQILVLGAGRSSPFLIRHLLARAVERDWRVTVADRDLDLAAAQTAGHPRGDAVALDVADEPRTDKIVAAADLVLNLLPQSFQSAVAHRCLEHHASMVCASYTGTEIKALDSEARGRGLVILTEMGLDPGIDHMASMELIDRARRTGGTVIGFESYGGGLPAPDSATNPFRYAVTWNPRNVVMAGEDGAHYLRHGDLWAVPATRVFTRPWTVQVHGVGPFEAYPNRDSLTYRRTFDLGRAETLIRGTLRYPGWCEAWSQIVRLGLPSERFAIPHLAELGFRDLVQMFLPEGTPGASVEARAACFLGLDLRGEVMEKMRWLGLFDSEPCGAPGTTAAEALTDLLHRRLTLPPGGRDMVILYHQLVVDHAPEAAALDGVAGTRERIVSTMVEYGEPDGLTAMARTVGLPLATVAELLLGGEIGLAGCHIPTEPSIYRPVLAELARQGLAFEESSTFEEPSMENPLTTLATPGSGSEKAT